MKKDEIRALEEKYAKLECPVCSNNSAHRKMCIRDSTYAALRLFIDNDRWRGAPFYIRTGKKLGEREMNVVVTFRRPRPDVAHNVLVIRIQPTEGVYLQFNIQKPGDTTDITQAKMDFCQSCLLENRINTPEAYERLIGACIRGEHFWFSQWDPVSYTHLFAFIMFKIPLCVNRCPCLAFLVGMTQSKKSTPRATPSIMLDGVPTPIK